MTFKDLIESKLVKPDDQIQMSIAIFKNGSMSEIRKGHWLSDGILEWVNKEIIAMSYDREKGYSILLDGYLKKYGDDGKV